MVMSERMSDSFIISLPWTDAEFTEVSDLVQQRRTNTSRLFITFLLLCCLTYLTTDDMNGRENSQNSTEDADDYVGGDGSSTAKRKGAAAPVKIFLCVFTMGFVTMFFIMNKLKWIERQLDCRIERSFGIGGGGRAGGVNLAEREVEGSAAWEGDRGMTASFILPGGWDLGGSGLQPSVVLDWERLQRLRQERRRMRDSAMNTERGVSTRAKEQWTRFLIPLSTSDAEDSPLLLSQIEASSAQTRYGSVGTTNLPINSSDHDPSENDRQENDGYDADETPSVEQENTGGASVCSICLGEYVEGEKAVRLPCGHVYHDECVSLWVSNHVRCPLCNFNLEEEFPV